MDFVRRVESSNKCRELILHPNLPQEIINEILLRLPVQSLLKFKCVCKSWLTLISSSQFIKTHMYISKQSNKYSNYQVILASRQSPKTLYTCPLSSIFSNTAMDNSMAFDLPMNVTDYKLDFVGSCNGLVCICIIPDMLVLYNPSIRKLKTLPVSGTNTATLCGFCYDEIGDDFKVVELSLVRNQAYMVNTEVKVYSLRNDSWRKIENNYDGFLFRSGDQSVGGILHWHMCSNDGAHLIFAVNTVTNMYDTLEPPKDVGKDGIKEWNLGDLNGCLAVFLGYHRTRLDVWAMKEYGVKESWSKVVSIPYPANLSGHIWPVCVC